MGGLVGEGLGVGLALIGMGGGRNVGVLDSMAGVMHKTGSYITALFGMTSRF